MVSIIGKTGIKWGSYISYSPITQSFARSVHGSFKRDETNKTIKVAKEEFISPELKRDLLENWYRSQKQKTYRPDGLPGPGDRYYDEMIRDMFDDLKSGKIIGENTN